MMRSTLRRAQPTGRGADLAEKVTLGFIAGAAAAVAAVELVVLVIRITGIVAGPVTLVRVPTAEALEAGFAGATFDTVDVTVDDLSSGGRAAAVASTVLASLLTIGICLVLAWLCLRVFRGTPFVRSATWGIGAVAILVLLVALGRPVLDAVAAAEAAAALGTAELPPFLVLFDPAPIGWAFALTVVAAAFEIGQRMQRDTRGLV